MVFKQKIMLNLIHSKRIIKIIVIKITSNKNDNDILYFVTYYINNTSTRCIARNRETDSLHCWWECNLVQPLWSTFNSALQNVKYFYPFTFYYLSQTYSHL